ncbi:FtsX-like permease family protein, partial [candidate division KSB1 bacterium]
LFDMFSIPVIRGSHDAIVTRPFTIALTESMVEKYFGNDDPIGKIINANQTDYEITAVIKDPQRNTHMKYNFIASMDLDAGNKWRREGWTLTVFYTYLKLRPEVDIISLENDINTILKSKPGQLGDEWYYFLQPVKDLHLKSDLLYEFQPPGNPKYLYIFSIIGIFILLIAAVNFINLTTARSTSRAKEVGMRKVIGARKKQLIRQFLGESMMISLIAVIFAFCLVWLFLPMLSGLTGIEYINKDLINSVVIGGLLIIACVIGIGAGIYPAFLLSGFRPVMTLKGIFRTTGGIELRKYLVVFQFAISVLLIISTLIVYYQLSFMKNTYLGFDKEQKLVIPVRFTDDNHASVKNEFLQHNNITGATASYTVPGRGNQTLGVTLEGGSRPMGAVFYQLTVDYDFISEYNLEITEGKGFVKDKTGDPSKVCMVNETGVKLLGFDNDADIIGRIIRVGSFSNFLRIIGVLNDFHYRGLQQKIDPLVFVLPQSEYGGLRTLTLTVDTQNLPETLEFVENKWKDLNLGPIFSYSFLDEEFDSLYRTEERVGQIFSTFTALGLFIAFLGLFGLALFTAEQRTKEIGIRKTLGATIMSIIQLLTKEFVKWVAVGIIIAFPAAYFAMDLWLQNFAYRIEIGWLPFAASAALAILLSIITVSFHAIKSATANPVDSLRYE